MLTRPRSLTTTLRPVRLGRCHAVRIVSEYLYLGGQRIARVYRLYGGVYYYYGDFLETSRVMADENGDKCYDADYFPWGGGQYVCSTNTGPQNYKFTGKERDPDMGIDDFGAPPGASGLAGFEDLGECKR